VPLALGAVLEEARELVAAQKGNRGIRFETAAGEETPFASGVEGTPLASGVEGTPLAWADPGAVLQILLNLLLNAADAVQDAAEPVVRLELGPALLRGRAADGEGAGAAARAQADAVECRVSDNGSGIAEGDRERVFDPFFTTKPPGQGTGLGLSTALRLAEEMEGALLLVDPPAGFATSFALRLPCAPREGSNAVRRGGAGAQPDAQCAEGCGAETPSRGPGDASG
jgi:signal transduction histidine kinase